MATRITSEPPSFRDPDGRPVFAEAFEAGLRKRVATCEAALEDAIWELAWFLSLVGRPAEAMACVTHLLAGTADPEKQADGFLALGQLLEQQERYAEAAEVYARGLAILPPGAPAGYLLHNNRGYCLNDLGRHAEAEAHCRTAIALNPIRHNAHKNLGLALAGQGRFVEAAHCLLEADRRYPADPRARRHLAELLAGNPEILETDPVLVAACRDRGIRPGPAGRA